MKRTVPCRLLGAALAAAALVGAGCEIYDRSLPPKTDAGPDLGADAGSADASGDASTDAGVDALTD